MSEEYNESFKTIPLTKEVKELFSKIKDKLDDLISDFDKLEEKVKEDKKQYAKHRLKQDEHRSLE